MNRLFKILLVSVVLITSALLFAGCKQQIQGGGNIVRKEIEVAPFSVLEASGGYRVYLTHGAKEKVIVEADSALFEYLHIRSTGRKLQLRSQRIDFTEVHLRVYITFTHLDRISLSGASEVVGHEQLSFNRLSIKCSGASNVDLELNAQRLNVELSGASQANLNGTADRLQADLSGSSKFYASGFLVNHARVATSGASHASLHVAGKLDARASGASSITYYGNPDVSSSISGASTVNRIN